MKQVTLFDQLCHLRRDHLLPVIGMVFDFIQDFMGINVKVIMVYGIKRAQVPVFPQVFKQVAQIVGDLDILQGILPLSMAGET